MVSCKLSILTMLANGLPSSGGISLSTGGGTIFYHDLPSDQTQALADWFANERPNLTLAQMTATDAGSSLERDARMVGIVAKSGLARIDDQGRGIYLTIVGTIVNIKTENCYYKVSCEAR